MKSIAKANLVKKKNLFRQKHLFYENCDQFFRTWGHPDGNGTCTPLVNQKSEARNDMIFTNLETWRHVRGTGWMGKKSCSKSCREACPVWGNFQQHRFRNKCLTVIHLYLNTYHLYMYKMCIYILYVHVKYTELFSGGHWFLLGNAFKQQTIETSWWISKTFNCFLPSSRFYKSVHVHCHTISF